MLEALDHVGFYGNSEVILLIIYKNHVVAPHYYHFLAVVPYSLQLLQVKCRGTPPCFSVIFSLPIENYRARLFKASLASLT